MRKLAVLIIIIFIVSIIAVPVFAAQSAQVSVSVSKDTVTPGDTFTVTVSTSAVNDCISGGFMFSYNKDIFEYVKGSALIDGFTMAGVTDMAGSLSGYFMNISGSKDIQGELFQVTFKVKDAAPSGSYIISGTPNITVMNGNTKESITCSASSATVTVVSCFHNWSDWTASGNARHSRTCSVCNNVETFDHNWNSGRITRQPTCKEAGAKVLTCVDCNATTTETIAVLTTHTYDHSCDTDCNVCDAIRVTTHQYQTTWKKDKHNHWHECSVCKEKKDIAAHTPGAEATDSSAQICTACDYIINPALGHQHDFASDWSTDEGGHWYACPGCEEKDSYADHNFENDCDPDCSACGYSRITAHIFGETMGSDATHHWLICTKCGFEHNKGPHEPGSEATEAADQTCTVCDYVIVPALNASDIATDPAEIPNRATDGQITILVPFIAIAVCAAAVCVLMLILVRKKRAKKRK